MTVLPAPYGHILSIQSAVLAGSVGNNAAGAIYDHFKLTSYLLDTVKLAAHPGYGAMHRDVTSAKTFDRLLRDFYTLPAFDQITVLQTGYLGAIEQVDILAEHISKIKQHTSIDYYLDPVMGDGGRLYIADTIADSIAEKLLPIADIITPNLFEFERLTHTPFQNQLQLITSAQKLISDFDLKAVLVTAIPDETSICDMLITTGGHFEYRHAKQAQGHSGAGDALTALLISFITQGDSLSDAAKKATEMVSLCAQQADDPRDLAIKFWLANQRPDSPSLATNSAI